MPPETAPFLLAAVCVLLSGAGALAVETVWLRWLRLLLGATAPAVSATLVAFFAGQAAGAALAARAAPSLRRPLRAYAGVELLAIGLAAVVPTVLGFAEATLADHYDALRGSPGRLTLARFAVAWVATFPAAVAFGATLPLLAAAVVTRTRALGSIGNGLYAVQTFGAAGGAALAAFWLPAAYGVRGTYSVGLAAFAAAAGLAWVGSLRAAPRPPAPEAAVRRRRRTRALPGPRRRLALAALSGFVSFAVQVLWVQAFALVLDQSVQAFGAVLVSVLVTLGLGASASALGIGSGRIRPDTLLRIGLVGGALGLAAIPALFVGATDGLTVLRTGAESSYPAAILTLAALTGGPGLLAAALVFPATIALEGRADARAHGAARLGRLLAANTLGAIAGALVAPYGLLPTVGLWGGFATLACLFAAAALWLPGPRSVRLATVAPLAAGLVVLGALASPVTQPAVRLEAGEELAELTTTPHGLVAVIRRPDGLVIETDNHYTLGGTSERVHQERQAHLPLVLHGTPKRVAYVGSATGISAGATRAHPVETLHVVELVPEVARAARRHFGPWNRDVYSDPRTEVVLDDGRNYLRATRDRFDVVVADLFVPWRSGTGALYTREHFAAVRDRLAPGGLFCQWLPLYQLAEPELLTILVTFLDVFPQTALFRGDFYGRFPIVALVGWRDGAPAPEAIDAAATALGAAGVTDRWVTEPLGIWSLYVAPGVGLEKQLARVPRNLDDDPVVEFGAPRHRRAGSAGSVVGLSWVELSDDLASRFPAEDPLFGPLGPERAAAAAGGRWLQRADALWAGRRPAEAAEALAEAAKQLPAGLFRAAPPDPTAAGLWHDTAAPQR
jgi:spermidine synthase